jgi:hypothetical protein
VESWDRWLFRLTDENEGHLAMEAVFPRWEAWRSRGGLPITYRSNDGYLSKLWEEQGHDVAHAEVLSRAIAYVSSSAKA